jgi:hypothetical protein
MGIIRKVFDVRISNKLYGVWDIEGKEHGGWNGEPKTWWVYYTDSIPGDMVPPIDSEHWEPYSKSINRLLWDIRFEESNSANEKWGSTNFRSHLSCEMRCNDKLVYSFGTRDMAFAFGKAAYLMTILCEHSYNFLEPEKEKGRKIWWYGLPALISPKSDGWEIGIIPDYTTGLDKVTWWKEFVSRRSNLNENIDPDDMNIWDDEDEGSDYINWGDALSDGHIGWHRK